MKSTLKLTLCFLLAFLGSQNSLFSQGYDKQVENKLREEYDSIWYLKPPTNFFSVMKDGKRGLIDHKGKIILQCKYDYFLIMQYDDPSKNNFPVWQNGKGGVYDFEGNEIIPPNKYDTVYYSPYTLKHLRTTLNGKVGMLDSLGREVVPCKYNEVRPWDKSYIITLNGKNGICDSIGKEIISCKYDDILPLGKHYLVTLNEKKGSCDLTGTEIVSCKYDNIILMDKYYSIKIADKEGVCDLTGKEIIPCKYHNIVFLLTDRYYSVTLEGKMGACNLAGKEIIPCEYTSLIYSSDQFKYKNENGEWINIDGTLNILKGDEIANNTTPAAPVKSTTNTVSTTEKVTTATEKLFFEDNQYMLQSNDISSIHMIEFSTNKGFRYMIISGGSILSDQKGHYEYNDGTLKVFFDNNTEMEHTLVKLSKYSIKFVNNENDLTFAKMFSPEDLFSVALLQNNGQSTTVQPLNSGTNNKQSTTICSSCNGSGRQCVLKTVPTYGTQSNVKQRCPHCSELLGHGLVHVQQKCVHCQGKGYK